MFIPGPNQRSLTGLFRKKNEIIEKSSLKRIKLHCHWNVISAINEVAPFLPHENLARGICLLGSTLTFLKWSSDSIFYKTGRKGTFTILSIFDQTNYHNYHFNTFTNYHTHRGLGFLGFIVKQSTGRVHLILKNYVIKLE